MWHRLIGWVWCVPGAWWVQRPQKGEILNSACREIPLQFGVSQGILGTQWVSWGWYWTCASLSFSDDRIIVVLKKWHFYYWDKIKLKKLLLIHKYLYVCVNLFVWTYLYIFVLQVAQNAAGSSLSGHRSWPRPCHGHQGQDQSWKALI